jgi:hypothetical protein
MNPKITIIATGEKLEESKVQSAFEAVPDLKLTKVGQDRGLAQGAKKVFTWIAEFVGGSAKVTDALIEQASKQFAGAMVKVKVGSMEVEINNANRSQILELLDRAAQMAKETENL